MAVGFESLEDFRLKFNDRKKQRDLFAFFLFDDRPSNRAVADFARDQFDWLDDLARSAKIFFFIFVQNDIERGLINPGLEVGNMFGIRANEVPGIILFRLDPDTEEVSVTDGIFFPLKSNLFETDKKHAEDVLSDLISLIQECRKEASEPHEFYELLKRKVERLKRRESLHPFIQYVKGVLKNIADLPSDLIPGLAKAYGEAWIRQNT